VCGRGTTRKVAFRADRTAQREERIGCGSFIKDTEREASMDANQSEATKEGREEHTCKVDSQTLHCNKAPKHLYLRYLTVEFEAAEADRL
jgi:hypothetical protein